ncbi:hypothetical protein TNCV_1267441 [Trichonephila clavipes]|nr:hypothetical protein TNCV_1267441 [Trichonephila clavipes]
MKEVETDQAIEEPTEKMHINQNIVKGGTIKIMIGNWVTSSECLRTTDVNASKCGTIPEDFSLKDESSSRKPSDVSDEVLRKMNRTNPTLMFTEMGI